ncbi:hypothetical protein ACOCJ4_13770 [Knoellia sp. CPCC 206435]|uniref:hypothetical protein n=1 Tax=Knoellia terrae TaxID=3404797 RepID=UPI003B42D779
MYEIKISGGDRMLVHWDTKKLVLLDTGGHETVPRYDAAKLRFDLEYCSPAPPDLLQRPLFQTRARGELYAAPNGHFPGENEGLWAVHLDDEQGALFDCAYDALRGEEPSVHVFAGGPGTGKTAILASLLSAALDLGNEVRLSAMAGVVDYLEFSTDLPVADHLGTAWDSVDVLLLDDPNSLYEVQQASRSVLSGRVRFLAIGVDPMQLNDSVTDSEWESWAAGCHAQVGWLRDCYRQKEEIADLVLPVIRAAALSGPSSAQGENLDYAASRRRLLDRSGNLRFVNPNGYVRVYREPSIDDVRGELARLRIGESSLWKHWPALLLVSDNESDASLIEEVRSQSDWLFIETISLEEALRVKGVEFQHGFVFMSQLRFQDLQSGVAGDGERAVADLRLSRIPLTRARDSLVFFVY